MKILVLGGSGFIGSHLIPELASAGHQVVSFDRSISSFKTEHPNVSYVVGDICQRLDLKSAITGCDIIYHLVSTTLPQSSNENPVYDIETNLISLVNLLEEAKLQKAKRIIFASSGGTIYGEANFLPITEDHVTNPICSYGIVKLAMEKYLSLYSKLFGVDYTILRLANPFGEHQNGSGVQGVVGIFLNRIISGQTIEIWGDGETIRDYIYIEDVIKALIQAMGQSAKGQVLNIGTGVGTSINQLLVIIEDVLNIKTKVIYKDSRKVDVKKNYLSFERTKKVLNWSPNVKLGVGIRRLIDGGKQKK